MVGTYGCELGCPILGLGLWSVVYFRVGVRVASWVVLF